MTCLITGASSGLGLAFAHHAASQWYNLILTGRQTETLEWLKADLSTQFPHQTFTIISADLSTTEWCSTLCDLITTHDISLLIANAEFGLNGCMLDHARKDIEALMNVNMIALTRLVHHTASIMKTKKSGRILTVASIAWFQPLPSMDVYAATKSFVISLSNSLHYHCKKFGITVSCLCPGPTKTAFAERAGLKDSLIFKIAMDCDEVITAGRTWLMEGKRLIIPWRINKALSVVSRITPAPWSMKIGDILG